MSEVCRDCGRVTWSPYWFSVKGVKLKQPRCPECHERTIWSGAAEREDDANEVPIGWTLRGKRWEDRSNG